MLNSILKIQLNKKKDILESIKKIRDDGDKDKLNYVNNLYRYYCFFLNLNHLIISHPIIYEKKYYCKEFFYFLRINIINTSKEIITGIINAIANDEPLDPFFKNIMRDYIYEE